MPSLVRRDDVSPPSCVPAGTAGAGRARSARLTLAAGCVVALGAVTACGSTRIDTAKLEGIIKAQVTTAFPDHKVGTVACPPSKDVKVEAGGTFECTAEIGGATGRFTVTQTDAKGNVTFAAADSFLVVKQLNDEIAKGIKDQTQVDAVVSCGDSEIVAYAPAATFTCAVTAGDQKRDVTVTVKDTKGNVDWKL